MRKTWSKMLPWMILIAIGMAIFAHAAQETDSGINMTYQVDAGIRHYALNESDATLIAQARAGTQPQVLTEQATILDLTIGILPIKFKDSLHLFDFKNMTTEIIYSALSLVLNNSYGTIDFNQVIDLTSRDFYDIDRYVNISANHIEINGTALPEFSGSSRITITNIGFAKIRILKDGENCAECTIISYSNNDLIFNAPGFTIYEAINGTVYPGLKLSRSVLFTNSSMNVTGKPYNNSYPTNITIDLGGSSTIKFNFTGELNTTTVFNNFTEELNSLASACNCAGCALFNNGLTCTIYLAIASATPGEVLLSALNISQVIRNVSWSTGTNYTLIDLDDYFSDRDNDALTYNYTTPQNISIQFSNGTVILIPDYNYVGVSYVIFNATDGTNVSYSNNVTLNVTADTVPPWFSSQSTNGSSLTMSNDNVSWQAVVHDNIALSSYLFSTNASGSWVNGTAVAISGVSATINDSAIITKSGNNVVCGMFYFNDTAGFSNSTDKLCFTTANVMPDILSVLLSDTTGSYDNCTATTCTLTPVAGSNISLAAQVVISDNDQDCDTNAGQVWLHLCYNNSEYTTCNEALHNWTAWRLNQVTRSGLVCNYVFSQNLTAADGTPEFFRLPGSYMYYINASDGIAGNTNDAEGAGTWRFGSLAAVNFTPSLILGNGTVTLGTWNNGTTEYNMTNFGNIVVDILWNATNPVSGASTWILNGSDMILDDDPGFDKDGGVLPAVFINGTPQFYNLSTGIEVCLTAMCNNPDINETLPTHWHIALPLGLPQGTYTTTIEYTVQQR